MSLSLTYRLRGASYRIRGATYRPERHYLCMLSPAGVFPLPLKLWLAFRSVNAHGPSFFLGLSIAFALFVMKRKEKVFGHFMRTGFLDRLILQPWVKMWLKYLRRYAEVSVNYDVSLEVSRASCCTNVYIPL